MQTLPTPPARNGLYLLLGAAALLANKLRHTLRGYRNPRPFASSDYDRAIAYDLGVVDAWLARLGDYLGHPYALRGKSVLELGPGADLGVGLTLLALGAARYAAADVNPLAATVPKAFYERLVEQLMLRGGVPPTETEALLAQVEASRAGQAGRLDYRCLPEFDIKAFGAGSIDLFVSQAAFEHFDAFAETARQMARLARPGALLVSEIDLNTHTRWLRDNDPHSIYRFPAWVWRLCRFPGIPNRLRPADYVAALEAAGWTNIRVMPLTRVSDEYLNQVRAHLARPFQTEAAQMQFVHVVLYARWGQVHPGAALQSV